MKMGKENNHRPYKMTKFTTELTEVINTQSILFLTDKDLLFLVNDRLEDKDKINDRTFKNWKAGKFHENEEIGKVFFKCVEKALITQKQEIGKKLIEDTTGQWTRYAWILERKFSEWNLKHLSEFKNEQTQVIQITAGNDEQKKMIDNLINPEFTEIKPTQIPENNNTSEDYGF